MRPPGGAMGCGGSAHWARPAGRRQCVLFVSWCALCGGTPAGHMHERGPAIIVGNIAPSVAFLLGVGGLAAGLLGELPMRRPHPGAGHIPIATRGAATTFAQRALRGVAVIAPPPGGFESAAGDSEQWPQDCLKRSSLVSLKTKLCEKKDSGTVFPDELAPGSCSSQCSAGARPRSGAGSPLTTCACCSSVLLRVMLARREA